MPSDKAGFSLPDAERQLVSNSSAFAKLTPVASRLVEVADRYTNTSSLMWELLYNGVPLPALDGPLATEPGMGDNVMVYVGAEHPGTGFSYMVAGC